MSEKSETKTKKRRVSAAERSIEVAEKRERAKLLDALGRWAPYRRARHELTGGPVDDLEAAAELARRLVERHAAEASDEEPEVVT